MICQYPSMWGLWGSPSTSLKLWCLRWTATHSRGEMLVSIQVPKRIIIVSAGGSRVDRGGRRGGGLGGAGAPPGAEARRHRGRRMRPEGPVREHAVQVDGGDKRGELA